MVCEHRSIHVFGSIVGSDYYICPPINMYYQYSGIYLHMHLFQVLLTGTAYAHPTICAVCIVILIVHDAELSAAVLAHEHGIPKKLVLTKAE